MKKAILLLITILTFTSCQKSKVISKIVGTDWLLGKWENKSTDGNLLENWTKLNDSVYDGQSYFIKGKDTLHNEHIQLVQKGEELFYISNIKGQNNDKPVTFIKKDTIAKQLIFENPKNNYPKKISYNPFSNDVLIIEISGIQQGKPSFDTYTLKKTK
ncbi:hypothetical protein FNW25_13475 [Flavobacterium franklandianum]|uniref:DUF6265 domain-containing protein n=1 Tax=Flavobacterium franklandianum TaxID=2594430 RepID=A0A553CJN9_9FLAO|nr:DUF6265 family protein [Flavobacterium franklandianum]TRX20711.1 hypothetical protein FNW17_10040 [Flavobacterium franklandianum]TRX23297.1 hypothetical protein FNW25_13475 [Flavobacterium franklandianum]